MENLLLAIESSTKSASLALWNLREDRLVNDVVMPITQRTARWLAPTIRDQLQDLGVSPADVGVVALTSGPGSFTGLRIGVTFAKVFCYATSAKLVAVDTLEVIARQVTAEHTIHAVMDAMRGEYFYAAFGVAANQPNAIGNRRCQTCIKTRQQLIDAVEGPGTIVGRISPEVHARLPTSISVIDDDRANPSAGTVAELACERIRAGQFDDPWTLVPNYFRKTYAEEKRVRPE